MNRRLHPAPSSLLLALAVAAAPPPPACGQEKAARPHVFKRVVVLAIGVNKYPDLLGVGNLKYAEVDAESVAKVLRENYGYEVVPLLGDKATRVGIEKALKNVGDDLGEEDALVIYFAGHG